MPIPQSRVHTQLNHLLLPYDLATAEDKLASAACHLALLCDELANTTDPPYPPHVISTYGFLEACLTIQRFTDSFPGEVSYNNIAASAYSHRLLLRRRLGLAIELEEVRAAPELHLPLRMPSLEERLAFDTFHFNHKALYSSQPTSPEYHYNLGLIRGCVWSFGWCTLAEAEALSEEP